MSWLEPDPEAVVQEVWLRVLRRASTYNGQAKVSTWLHRITVNEAISAARPPRLRQQPRRAAPDLGTKVIRDSGAIPNRPWERLRREPRQTTMRTNHAADRPDAARAGAKAGAQSEITRLFAVALGGDRGAEAAVNLLRAYEDTAHRASFALATAGHNGSKTTPLNVLASIDRTLAALRDRARSVRKTRLPPTSQPPRPARALRRA